MALTKILFRAWGAVSVGASECVNATVQSDLGVGVVTDVAVDSKSTVWITSKDFDPDANPIVWMCPVDGDCVSVGSDWGSPSGIVVDDSDGVTTVYISDLGKSPTISAGVRKCILTGEELDCDQFGDSWGGPSGLASDHEGNVLVTNAHYYRPSSGPPVKSHGVWRCSPSADCVLVEGSDHWYEHDDHERNVAVDSEGNVYVSGAHDRSTEGKPPVVFVEKCTSAGTCDAFGPTWDHSAQGAAWLGLAVGPDDNVYIRDVASHNFFRCSPGGFCENVAFDGGPGSMAIDQNGIIYTVSSEACHDDNPGCSQLELRKFCFELPTDIIQV